LVFNLKAEPTEIVDHPNRQWYKAEAIGQFISDALIFFKRLFEQKPSLTVLLVPVPPSASRSDPNYDDRLVQVVNNLANSCSNITADDILAFDETQQPSHIGGSRNPDELLKSLRFVGPTGTPPDVIFVLDDVISSGAHYHACKTLLSRHYSDSQIAGLFWAKTIPESVTYHYFPDIQ
jgi:predicted amidophosphoribosyltransferase